MGTVYKGSALYTTVCTNCGGYCGHGHTCSASGYWTTYPNFPACTGVPCPSSGVNGPKAHGLKAARSGCGPISHGDSLLWHQCGSSYTWYGGAPIRSCGPSAATGDTSVCANHTGVTALTCMGHALWKYLSACSTNPMTHGALYTWVSVP